MALADSARAIGAATRLLQDHLIRRGFDVSVGKPEEAALANTAAKLNLFLYETTFDPALKNFALDERTPPPLWFVLKYLLTAFDEQESSDSADAHELLGRGIAALHELNYITLDAAVALPVRQALENNPEPLKVTFDDATADLLSKIMQGTDERYRLSVALQLRPVMIVPGTPPAHSLLVGIDYTAAPPAILPNAGQDGVQIDIVPSLGAVVEAVEPAAFAPGEEIELRGVDLHLSGLEPVLGDVVLEVIERRPDRMRVLADGPFTLPATEGPIAAGGALAAGEHPLFVRRAVDATHTRSSAPIGGRLLPVLTGASVAANAITIDGTLLGREEDAVVVALHRDGRVARAIDAVTATADQKSLVVPLGTPALAPGAYRVIVRVNGQQARSSPTVTLP